MLKRTIVAVVILLCATGVYAQSTRLSGVPAGIDRQTVDLLPMGSEAREMRALSTGMMEAMKGGGVSVETVGDPYSFGHNQTYLGLAQTELVFLEPDCSLYTPEDGRCIEPNAAPAVTSVDENDLAVIELPGKATRTILCFTFTPFATWQWENNTLDPQLARMFLSPRARIESEVLNDPTLINPNTGLPFDGVLSDTIVPTFRQARTLDPGEFDFQSHATTRSCTGGLVSERSLREQYGLSDQVIKNFFKEPITVTFGVRGSVSMVTAATYLVGIRLYGD